MDFKEVVHLLFHFGTQTFSISSGLNEQMTPVWPLNDQMARVWPWHFYYSGYMRTFSLDSFSSNQGNMKSEEKQNTESFHWVNCVQLKEKSLYAESFEGWWLIVPFFEVPGVQPAAIEKGTLSQHPEREATAGAGAAKQTEAWGEE